MSFASYINAQRAPEVSVDIVCGCNSKRPVEDLLIAWDDTAEFYGPRLLCDSCSEPVIDTYFCPTCLNSFFSSVAINSKLRCGSCLNCPSCCCLLAAMVGDDGRAYLSCPACKWDSNSIGLTAASLDALRTRIRGEDGAGEAEARFNQLGAVYAARHAKMMQMETEEEDMSGVKMDRDQMRDSQTAIKTLEMKINQAGFNLGLPPHDVVHDFSEEEGHKTLEPAQVTSCRQRLMQSRARYGNQDGWPSFARLTTKLAFKDPKTEQFLVKPKAGANKTDFDKQCNAHVWLPRVTLQAAPPPLAKDQEVEVVLVFRNHSKSAAATLQLQSTEVYLQQREEDRKMAEAEGVHDDDEVLPTVVDLQDTAAATFGLPADGVAMGKAPEGDEEEVKTEATEHVAFTSQNAVGVKVKVTPKGTEGPVVFSLVATVRSEGAGDAVIYQMQVTLGPLAA